MADIDNIVLEHLQVIRSGMDRIGEDMREVTQRLGHLEAQAASLGRRLDRLDGRIDRIERIERRLELVE